MKIALNKFEFPTRGDERMELIEKRFGMIGFAVIVKLLERIYGTNGYFCTWNNSFIALLAQNFGIKVKMLSDIVAYAVSIGFFDGGMLARKSILTSADIQSQYFRAVSKRAGVTYDPSFVIGDFYKSCRRAVPIEYGQICDSAIAPNTQDEQQKDGTPDATETVETAETVAKAEKAEKASSAKDIDPITEMRCKHMFASGKTVPLAQLIEMTGASSLVPPEAITEITAQEVCSPEEAMAAMVEDESLVNISDVVDALVEAEAAAKVSIPEGEFVRDRKKPRCDKVYGQFFNVLLDDDEYNDLVTRIPNADNYIQRLSKRLLDKNFKCESAYNAIIDCYRKENSRSLAAA